MVEPYLGHAVVINNLATEVPDTVEYVHTFTETLTKIGFKVDLKKDMSFKVNRHSVSLTGDFHHKRKI